MTRYFVWSLFLLDNGINWILSVITVLLFPNQSIIILDSDCKILINSKIDFVKAGNVLPSAKL